MQFQFIWLENKCTCFTHGLNPILSIVISNMLKILGTLQVFFCSFSKTRFKGTVSQDEYLF
jgi:hypothetical protein